jgi:hypothetical protein
LPLLSEELDKVIRVQYHFPMNQSPLTLGIDQMPYTPVANAKHFADLSLTCSGLASNQNEKAFDVIQTFGDQYSLIIVHLIIHLAGVLRLRDSSLRT